MGILSAFASQNGLLGSPPASPTILGQPSDAWLRPQQSGPMGQTPSGYTPPAAESNPMYAPPSQDGQPNVHNAIMNLFSGTAPSLGIPQIAPINLPAPEAPFAQGYGGVPSHILQTGG